MPESIIHPPEVRYCRPCPIESCAWHYDETGNTWDEPQWVEPDAVTIAEHGGDRAAAAAFVTLRAAMLETEAALLGHFRDGHTLEQWVLEVMRLNAKVAGLEARDAETRDLLARMNALAAERGSADG